jgi:hypothetical protein
MRQLFLSQSLSIAFIGGKSSATVFPLHGIQHLRQSITPVPFRFTSSETAEIPVETAVIRFAVGEAVRVWRGL